MRRNTSVSEIFDEGRRVEKYSKTSVVLYHPFRSRMVNPIRIEEMREYWKMAGKSLRLMSRKRRVIPGPIGYLGNPSRSLWSDVR